MPKVKVVSRNVNSKALYKEINNTIYDAIDSLGVKWSSESHRVSFVEVIEDYLHDLEDEGKIQQTKVICDKRNNRTFSKLAEEYVFEVFFRQPICLNVTSISYHVSNRKST